MHVQLLKGFLILAVVWGLAACDFDITNPGPIQEDALNDPGARNSVVQGANFALSEALWQVSYHGEESTNQVTRSGRNFCCPKVPPRVGELTRDATDNNTWNVAHEARFMAEDGARRFERVMDAEEFASSEFVARIQLIAGYANRILGENMCEAVIDGGEVQAGRVYFERAEAAFSAAIEVAQQAGEMDIVTAAYAGRASVRGPGLDNWTDAAADAQQVHDEFTYQAVYFSAEEDQQNHMWWLSSQSPWGDWTVFDSFFQSYYNDTGDTRTAWADRETSDTPAGLPLFEQQKFLDPNDDVNLSSGREMRLLEAEAFLREGSLEPAMTLINEVRTSVISDDTGEPLDAHEATTLDEGWAALMTERRVELWLEGRRMGDLRRWIGDDGVPNVMEEDMTNRIRLCMPINQAEVDSNPNVSSDHQDPVNPIYVGG